MPLKIDRLTTGGSIDLLAFVGVLEVDGTLVEADESSARAAGRSFAALRGQKLWDASVWRSKAVRARVREACKRAAQGESACLEASINGAGNGRSTVQLQITPVQDGEGRTSHLLATAANLSQPSLHTPTTAMESGFQTMADQLPLMVWMHDAAGRQEFVNQAFCEFFGVPREAMREGRWQALVHAEDAGAYLDAVAAAIREQAPFHAKVRVRHVDGEWRWIESWGRPRFDGAGRFRGHVGASADITEQKQIEARLWSSQERQRIAVSAAGLGVFEWNVPEDTVVWENERMYEIFGHSREDGTISQRQFSETYVHPDDLKDFQRAISASIKSDTPFHASCRVRRKSDGEWRWAEFAGEFTHAPDGSPLKMVGVVRDVTERKHAELTLHENEERLRLTTSAGRVGVWDWDVVKNTVTWSGAIYEIHGLEPGTFGGTVEAFSELVHPEDRAFVAESLERALGSDVPYELEFRAVRPDGALVWIYTQAQVIRDESGAAVRMLGATVDITARKTAELALRESEQRYELVLAGAEAGIWDWDVQNRRVSFSHRWKTMRGLSDEDVTNHESEWSSRIHPDDFDRVMAAVQAHFDGRTPVFSEEYRVRHQDGHWIWVMDRGLALRDASGRVARMAGSETDITEQKSIEEALHGRARQQQAVAELGEIALREPDLQALFDAATTKVAETLGVEYCKVLELLPGGEEVLLRSGVGWNEGLVGTARISTGSGSQAGHTLMSDSPVVVSDLRTERRFSGPPLLTDHQVVSGMSCVIHSTGGRAWGVLGAHSVRPIEFTQDDVHFLTSVANLIAEAIERQHADRALRASEERYRALSDNLKLLLETTSHLIEHLDTDKLLSSVIGIAREVVAVDAYGLWRADGAGAWRVVSSYGLSQEFIDEATAGTSGGLVPSEPIVVQPDDVADRSPELLRHRWDRYVREGIRSLMIVPLRIQGDVSGTLVFYCRTPHRFSEPEIESACALANIVSASLTTSELYESEARLRRRAEEATVREGFLAKAGSILSSSLEYEQTLANVAQSAVPDFADWAAVDVLDDEKTLRRLAVVHADPAKVRLAQDLREKYPPRPDDPNDGIFRVLRSGQAELVSAIPDELLVQGTRDEEHLRIIRELRLSSYICVPLRVNDEVRGTISFVGEGDRHFDENDLAVAEEIARRAAQAIDHALLYRTLHESEERYRAVVESQTEMICRFRPDGTILFVNEAYARAQGTTHEALLRANFWDFIDERDRPGVRELLERIRPDAPEVRIENRLETTEGPRWTLWSNRGLAFDADGRVTEAQSTGIDITKRKRAEAELEFQKYALDQASIVAITDVKGTITYVNDKFCEISGYSRDELLGQNHRILNSSLHSRTFFQDMYKTIARGRIWRGEIRNKRKDGVYYWVETTIVPELGPAGRPHRYVAIRNDITSRKLSESALQQARDHLERRVSERTAELERRAEQLARLTSELTLTEQRERQRLAHVLHDHLQQLLVGAKLRLGILKRAATDGNADGVADVTELIDEAIDASRSLTIELAPPILHEAGLAAGLEWLARWMKDKHGLAVDVQADERATADREDVRILLFQAVRELLFNVVKHSGVNRASVTLDLMDDAHLVIAVSDQGQGFDSDAALDGSERENAGFGLFSIRERLSLMGGQFLVESAVGEGTRFTLVAPRRPMRGSRRRTLKQAAGELTIERRATPREPVAAEPSGRIRVMVVDDHKVMRDGLRALIANEPDMEVIGEAADGVQAVERARSLEPDVVLMDFSMPRMDGVEATGHIKTNLPRIEVVALSMYEEPDRAAAMMRAGASAYHTKSGNANQLLETIRNACRAPSKPA